MKRKIYHAFLLVPVLLVLLHSVTPHHHFSFDEKVSLSASHSCPQTFLSQLFQIDLGANHLEDFETYRYEVDFLPDASLIASLEGWQLNASEEQVCLDYFIAGAPLFQNPFLAASHSLRAPPQA